jgi:hypothetical protein
MSIARTRWCSSSAPSSSPTTRTPRRAANTSTGGTVDYRRRFRFHHRFRFLYGVRLTVFFSFLFFQCSDLRPFALEHRDTTFILIHFSKRYSDDEIYAFFDNERTTQRELEAAEDAGASATGGCPKRRPAFDNVVVWLAGLGQRGAAES